MSAYRCGWCEISLLSEAEHTKHLDENPECLKRDGAISIAGFNSVQRIIRSIEEIMQYEKLDPDNELMCSEAKNALNQIHL